MNGAAITLLLILVAAEAVTIVEQQNMCRAPTIMEELTVTISKSGVACNYTEKPVKGLRRIS